MIGPGDGGPCPRCGQEMKEKEYDVSNIFGAIGPKKVRGRYWHMRAEHGTYEHYKQPRPEST